MKRFLSQYRDLRTRGIYCILRRHIIFLIAIRPLDGDVKTGGPLAAFRDEQVMSRHRVSHSFFLSSPSYTPKYNYATHTVTLT